MWTRRGGNEKLFFFKNNIRFQTEKVIVFQSIFLLLPSFPSMLLDCSILECKQGAREKLKLKKFSFLGNCLSSFRFIFFCFVKYFRLTGWRINAFLSFFSISERFNKKKFERCTRKRFYVEFFMTGFIGGLIEWRCRKCWIFCRWLEKFYNVIADCDLLSMKKFHQESLNLDGVSEFDTFAERFPWMKPNETSERTEWTFFLFKACFHHIIPTKWRCTCHSYAHEL